MIFDSEKFNKEIGALRQLPNESPLHPLRKEQIKQTLLQRLATAPVNGTGRFAAQTKQHDLWRYFVSVLVGLGMLGGTAFAAAGGAKPGDALYPIKKAGEQILLTLAVTDKQKIQLQTRFAQERGRELDEIRTQTAAAGTTTPATLNANNLAKNEVGQALITLEQVRTNMEVKGNTEAAAAVNQTIINLQSKISGDSKSSGSQTEAEGKNTNPQTSDNQPDNGGQNNTVTHTYYRQQSGSESEARKYSQPQTITYPLKEGNSTFSNTGTSSESHLDNGITQNQTTAKTAGGTNQHEDGYRSATPVTAPTASGTPATTTPVTTFGTNTPPTYKPSDQNGNRGTASSTGDSGSSSGQHRSDD